MGITASLVFEEVCDNLVGNLEFRLQFFVLNVDLLGRSIDKIAEMLEKGLADIQVVHEIGEKQFRVGLSLRAIPIIAPSALLASYRPFGRDLGIRHGLTHRNGL